MKPYDKSRGWFVLSLFSCLLILGPYGALAVEKLFTIDLSGTRSWEEVSASDAPFVELKNIPLSKVYRLENCLVAWKFPGGTTFRHHLSQGTVEYRDGQLRFITSYGEMMPLDEVLVVARQLHTLLGEPLEKLEKWEAEARAKGFQANTYSFGARNCNPVIDCEIRKSFGVVYPWIIVIHAGWLTDKEMKKPHPLPFTGGGLVNLDPPSGKRYTAEGDLEKYREMYPPKAAGEKDPPLQPAPAPVPRSTVEPVQQPFLWLWISLALLILAGVLLVVKRMRTK